MLGWIWKGLRTGIVTTRYPSAREQQPPGIRNRLVLAQANVTSADAERYAAVCPTKAISVINSELQLDLGRCIQCGLCARASANGTFRFDAEYELAVRSTNDLIARVPLQ